MNTVQHLLMVLVTAAITSAWWAAAMFATGENRMAFFPCAVATILATVVFTALHWEE